MFGQAARMEYDRKRLKTVSNGGKEQKRKSTQRMGGRHRRLGRGYTAETAPFGTGQRRMNTENQADTEGLQARRSWCMMITMLRMQSYDSYWRSLLDLS